MLSMGTTALALIPPQIILSAPHGQWSHLLGIEAGLHLQHASCPGHAELAPIMGLQRLKGNSGNILGLAEGRQEG